MFSKLKVIRSHGKQYIEDLDDVRLPGDFRGRPEIDAQMPVAAGRVIEAVCPTGAFRADPVSIDLGRCAFCGECARRSEGRVRFTKDYRMGTNVRENLIITAESPGEIRFDRDAVRDDIRKLYGRALKLREVSAGGDNSTEMELNASMNVNFDFGRYGVEFVASPRHADGVVITGPITANMAAALDICYCAVAEPKLVVMAGEEAVSGGLFAGSPAIDRSFLLRSKPDLWIPGNPVHPMTFIDAVRTLLGHGRAR